MTAVKIALVPIIAFVTFALVSSFVYNKPPDILGFILLLILSSFISILYLSMFDQWPWTTKNYKDVFSELGFCYSSKVRFWMKSFNQIKHHTNCKSSYFHNEVYKDETHCFVARLDNCSFPWNILPTGNYITSSYIFGGTYITKPCENNYLDGVGLFCFEGNYYDNEQVLTTNYKQCLIKMSYSTSQVLYTDKSNNLLGHDKILKLFDSLLKVSKFFYVFFEQGSLHILTLDMHPYEQSMRQLTPEKKERISKEINKIKEFVSILDKLVAECRFFTF